jgi:hypothetical protein
MSAGVIETSVRERERPSVHWREWRRRAILLRSAVCSGWCLKPWERESRRRAPPPRFNLPFTCKFVFIGSRLYYCHSSAAILPPRCMQRWVVDVWMCSLKLKTVWGLWWASKRDWLTDSRRSKTNLHTHARAFGPESVLILIGRRYFLPRANTNLAFAHTRRKNETVCVAPRRERMWRHVWSAKSHSHPPSSNHWLRVDFFAERNSNFINIMQNRSSEIMLRWGNPVALLRN